jgi:branched-chain amino acid transport system permease protein
VNLWAFILTPILIDAIAVLGLYIIASSGRLSIGHATYLGIGGYTAAVLSRAGYPPVAAAIAGTIVATVVGLAFAIATDRLAHWFFAITTLAFSVMLLGIVANSETLGGATGLYRVPITVGFTEALIALVLALGLVISIELSSFGWRLRAIRENELAAQALAIDVRRDRVLAFGLGCGLAGFAGALWVHYIGVIKPGDMGLDRSLNYLIFLCVGGIEFWGGAVAGSVLLGLLPEFLRFSQDFRLCIFGGLLTVTMLVRPSGLLDREGMLRIWRRIVPRNLRDRG